MLPILLATKLHMGHVRNYTIGGDVICPLPAYAGQKAYDAAANRLGRLRPAGGKARGGERTTPRRHRGRYDNIAYMKKQLKTLGFGYDWSRNHDLHPGILPLRQKFFRRLYKKDWCTRRLLPTLVPERSDRSRQRTGDRRLLAGAATPS